MATVHEHLTAVHSSLTGRPKSLTTVRTSLTEVHAALLRVHNALKVPGASRQAAVGRLAEGRHGRGYTDPGFTTLELAWGRGALAAFRRPCRRASQVMA